MTVRQRVQDVGEARARESVGGPASGDFVGRRCSVKGAGESACKPMSLDFAKMGLMHEFLVQMASCLTSSPTKAQSPVALQAGRSFRTLVLVFFPRTAALMDRPLVPRQGLGLGFGLDLTLTKTEYWDRAGGEGLRGTLPKWAQRWLMVN